MSDLGALAAPGASTSAQLGNLPTRFGLGDAVGPSRASSSAQPGTEVVAPVVKRFTPQQLEEVKPEARSYVLKHQDALFAHGFKHADIVGLSNRVESLEVVANRYAELKVAIPDLTHAQIVNVGCTRPGDLALKELLRTEEGHTLTVGAELTQAPLKLSAEQIAAIGAKGGRPALEAVHRLGSALTSEPLNLSVEQVVRIANNSGNSQALEAVKTHWNALHALGLTKEQVVAIASHCGGKLALEAVKELLPQLRELGMSTKKVVTIASRTGAKEALMSRLDSRASSSAQPGNKPSAEEALVAKGYTPEQLDKINREARLAVVKHHDALIGYGFSPAQIATIAAGGARPALETLHRLGSALTSEPLNLSVEQVVRIARYSGNNQALEAVRKHWGDLRALGLTKDQVVTIASHVGGKQALEAVKELWPQLLTAGISTEQVVKIASRGGAKLALMSRLDRLGSPAATATALGAGAGTSSDQTPAAARAKRAAPQQASTSRAVRPRLDPAPSPAAAALPPALGQHRANTQAGAAAQPLPVILNWGTAQAPLPQGQARPAQPVVPAPALAAAAQPAEHHASPADERVGQADLLGTPTATDGLSDADRRWVDSVLNFDSRE